MTSLLDEAPTAPGIPRTSEATPPTVAADLARSPLPPSDRPGAAITALDITKWFGETSGGVRTYLTEKARYVASRSALRHVLVVPGAFDGHAVGDGVRTYRIRGPLIPTQRAYRFLFATRTTRRVLEHERPDIIEVGSPFFVPWITALAARRLDAPLVAFHHTSLATLPHSLGMGAPGAALWRRGSGAYLRRLDRLFRVTIVASQYARDELAALGVERLAHIPLGVDLQRFHPRQRESRAATRRHFGLPAVRPIVLFVGRLAREKRLDVVLDAWPGVARATGALLAIVGAGDAEAALRVRAEASMRRGDVVWLPFQGDREDVARLYGAADVYVSPGEWETFGLSALEAMASAVPVVTPASGGAAELVQRADAGSAYEPGSPADAARALIAALDGARDTIGSAGRRYAEREHGWATVFDRLFTLYHEVLQA